MKYFKILVILTAITGITSCEDFLNPGITEQGEYETDFVWDNPGYARGPLYYAYSGLPSTFRTVSGEYSDIATDNAVASSPSSVMRNFALGQLSASANPMDQWANYYRYIRSLNVFMENGLNENIKYYKDSVDNARAFALYRGEAHFLRAWYHWSLLKLYGGRVAGEPLGIPVVKHLLTEEEAVALERNTYNETVWAIAADCDSAALYLPDEYKGNDVITGETHYGGPTTHAARALKAMAYTFAASPAYSDGTITWDSAAHHLHVALEALDGPVNDNPLLPRDFSNTTDKDIIWRSHFSINQYGNEVQNFPPTYRGEGLTNPSHDLVQSFPLSDGFPYDEHPENVLEILESYSPYQFSDPRLKKYILTDGSILNGSASLGVEDFIVSTFVGGEESREKNLITGTRTGYYLKKFVTSENLELYPQRRNGSTVYYTAISKTNLYLFFAEALNEMTATPLTVSVYGVSAKDVLNKIRGRVGFKSLVKPSDTKDYYMQQRAEEGKESFRDFIRNERRIELCFEDTRFWDLRRWGLDVNTPVHGIRITLDETSPNGKKYEEYLVETKIFTAPSLPIPFSETNLMPNLVQNEGWE